MPVYNASKFLPQAIDSILKQTYSNFEFVIVDDASKDDSWKILQSYARKDKRIKIYKNPYNRKAAETVDRAIFLSHGDFIARMDADDIALPSRLEKQLKYLLDNQDTVCVGGQCILINDKNQIIGEKTFPLDHKTVYDYIYRFIPIQQPAMMIARKRLPEDFDYYGHGMSPVEDVEFIFKLFKYGKVENMPDYVLYYRIHENNSSRLNVKKSFFLTVQSRIRSVFNHGYKPSFVGLMTTIAQLVVVALLPERLSMELYNTIKRKTVVPDFFAFNVKNFSWKLKDTEKHPEVALPAMS